MDALDLDGASVRTSRKGRLKAAQQAAPNGRYIRSAPIREGEREYDIAIDATIRAALLRQEGSGAGLPLQVRPADIRKKIYTRPQQTCIVFVVDSSDSMGDETSFARIMWAKSAVLGVLRQAYIKRQRVGLVSFRDETAEVVLRPTSSITLARRNLQALPTGGATPFAAGLLAAWQVVKNERLRDPAIRPLLVVFSDGEANVPADPGLKPPQAVGELLEIGRRIGSDGISSLVVDTRPLRDPSPVMAELAGALGGEYHHINTLQTSGIIRSVLEF